MSQFNILSGNKTRGQVVPLNDRQVLNDAGGYVYKTSSANHLRKLLVLGAPKVDYYVSPHTLLMRSVESMRKYVNEDPVGALDLISEVSEKGLGVSNDPALLALALALTNPKSAQRVRQYVTRVVRTGTHMLHFAAFIDQNRGWGRAARKAAAAWYEQLPLDNLAYQLLKYKQRDSWSHKDVIRLCHPKPDSEERSRLFAWAVGKSEPTTEQAKASAILTTATPGIAAEIVQKYRLTREMVPAELLAYNEVWKALLPTMPMTALVRNLGVLTSRGLFDDKRMVGMVAEKLSDREYIRKARVHPLKILAAHELYAAGHGMMGKLEWEPVPEISNALERAFEKSFDLIEPTGKSFLLGLDVSGSMTGKTGRDVLAPYQIEAAIALHLVKSEEKVDSIAFSYSNVDFPIRKGDSLGGIMDRIEKMPFGATDCAAPMLYALNAKQYYDVFVVITDNETYYGKVHPGEALRMYREAVNPNAKLVVLATRLSGFSIADPDDPLQLDIAGFSPDVTSAISAFAKM